MPPRTAAHAPSSVPTFAARVVAWQRVHGRHGLPWQQTRDAYRIWLSEVMLQQTQVTTVVPYFERFIARFPDVRALAAAPLDDVLAAWAGLGYYRRAHHLHAAAQAVARDHGGEFPTDATTLATLPGIGRSTAAAIAAFASGERGAILDGNVKRVLARHAGIDGWPGEPRVEKRLWDAAEARVPDHDIEAYTQGMMDLGALVCTRTDAKCLVCPVTDDCIARHEDRVDALPAPRPRKALPQRAVQLLVVERAGAVLLERRPAQGIWSGLWSLPEFAMEASPVDACVARFGVAPAACEPLPPIAHAFTHFALTMHPWRVRLAAGIADAASPATTWLTREDARGAALPAPIKRLLDATLV
ncbi:MAG: A/G-specific adenine glycosylase [Proteobacteria bacterium]|nr:A/G-specific adenine glycosylase [Pseudomonadota bacterium]